MNRNLSIRHLRCFIELADAGSFTAAAPRLFVTQSSLTATIQQFEEAVGVKLFDRTTRSVLMTAEAKQFKLEAEKIVRDFDSAIGDLQSYALGHRGSIRIAAAPSALYLFLARAVLQYRMHYPGVKVTLRDANARQVEQLVADGELDFAIATKFRGIADLEYTPLIKDHFGVICSPSYELPLSTEGMVDLHRLDAAEYVAFTDDTGIGSLIKSEALGIPLLQDPMLEVSSSTSLLAVLEGRSNFAIVPALMTTIPGFDIMRFCRIDGLQLYRQTYLVTRKLRSLSPSSQKLLDLISEIIVSQELPDGVSASSLGDTGAIS